MEIIISDQCLFTLLFVSPVDDIGIDGFVLKSIFMDFTNDFNVAKFVVLGNRSII
jgi:hypothetical protein